MASLLLAADDTGQNPFLPADYDIIWSLVPFALIVAFFMFFALPRFRKILDERADKIEGGLARAEAAQAEAQALIAEYEERLSEARVEAGRIREQARADGADILAEFKEQASSEAARITSNAQVQIEAERAAALVSLRSEVGALALDLASSIVGEHLADDAKSAALVDRFLADLDASDKAST